MASWQLTMVASRPSTAWAALWAACSQTHPPHTAIVIDAGPVSITSRVEWRQVVDLLGLDTLSVGVHRMPGIGIGKARHELLNASRGIIGWCDDDCLWRPDVAEEGLRALEDREVGIAAARQLTPLEVGRGDPRMIAPDDEPDDAYPSCFTFDGPNEPPFVAMHATFTRARYYEGCLATYRKPKLEDEALCNEQRRAGRRILLTPAWTLEMKHSEQRRHELFL